MEEQTGHDGVIMKQPINRRDWIKSLSWAALGVAPRLANAQQPAPKPDDLPLTKFEPRSALRVKETKVPRARYPLIDFHTHITFSGPMNGGDKITFTAQPAEMLPTMDHKNIRIMVNLTGGYGNGLREAIRVLQIPHPDRFIVFTEPTWSKAASPDYPNFRLTRSKIAHKDGAQGIEGAEDSRPLSPRADYAGKTGQSGRPAFRSHVGSLGARKMPVAIHTSDPVAFFQPIDRFNERWEELHNHPDWSFYGKISPSNRELQEARSRVIAGIRAPVSCVCIAPNRKPRLCSECLDSHPNMYVDMAARIGELGRQPRALAPFLR